MPRLKYGGGFRRRFPGGSNGGGGRGGCCSGGGGDGLTFAMARGALHGQGRAGAGFVAISAFAWYEFPVACSKGNVCGGAETKHLCGVKTFHPKKQARLAR